MRTIDIKYLETYKISELITCYTYYLLSPGCMNTTEFVHLLFIPHNRKHSSQHSRCHHRISISLGVDLLIQFVPSIKPQPKDKSSCYFSKVLESLFKVLTKTANCNLGVSSCLSCCPWRTQKLSQVFLWIAIYYTWEQCHTQLGTKSTHQLRQLHTTSAQQ